MVTRNAGVTWTTVRLPTILGPEEQRAAGLSELEVENVFSVSCQAGGTCIALGAEDSLNPSERQIVLRTDDF